MTVGAPDTVAQLQASIAAAFEHGAGRLPRAHQLDAVVELLDALHRDCLTKAISGSSSSLRQQPVNYLVQHSTGSGKSLTIASLVTALVGWRDALGAHFHTVLVVSDRLQLDRQLGDTVAAFTAGVAAAQPHRQLRVCQVESTSQLSELLSLPLGCDARPHIILTTMQKLATLQHKRGQAQRSRSSASGRQRASASAASRQGSVVVEREGALPSGQAGTAETVSPAAANGANGVHAGGDGGVQAIAMISSGACGGPAADEAAAAWAAAGRIAIIADEAHRHHGAGTTDLINEVLAAAAAAAAAVAVPGGAAAGPCVGVGRTGEDAGGATLGGCEADLALGQQDKLKGKGRGKGKAGAQGKGAAPIAQQPNNVTYIGFTATPGHRALQLFGVVSQVTCDALGDVVSSSDDEHDGEDGDGDRAARGQGGGAQAAERQPAEDEGDADAPLKARTERVTVFSPFHSYTMQQAISDGHILDVLHNYTAVAAHVTIAGAAPQEDTRSGTVPDLPEAAPSELRLVEAAYNSRELVRRKVAYLLPSFLAAWRRACDEGFHEMRAMVVTSSRQHVVWYVQELREALRKSEEFQRLQREAAAAAKQAAAAAKQGSHSQGSNSPAGSNSDSGCDGAGDVDQGHDPITAVFGAFSGNVPIAEGEYERLQEQLRARRALERQLPVAAAARRQGRRGGGGGSDTKAGGGGGSGKGRRRGPASRASGSVRGRSFNGWDAALAHLDAAAVKGGEAKGEGAEQEGGDDEEEEDSEKQVAEEEEEEEQEVKARGKGSKMVRTRRPDRRKRRGVDEGAVSKGRSRASKGSSSKSAADSDSGPEGSVDGSSSSEMEEEVEEDEAWLQDGGSEQEEGEEASSDASSDASSGAATSSSSGGESDDGDDSLSDSGSLDLTSRGASARAKRQGCRAGVEGGRVKRLRSSCSSVDVSGLASTATAFEGNAPTPLVQGAGGPAGSLGQGQGTDGAQQQPSQGAKQGGDITVGTEGSSGAVAAGAGRGGGVVHRAARQMHTEPAGLRRKRRGSTVDQERAQRQERKQQEQQRGQQEQPEGVSMVAITESELNGGNGASPAAARFLVVCSKYETGYDDPRLGAMFLDRPVSGAKAVQVLGRLNRPAPHLHKSARLLLVVDFANSAGSLRESFEEFWGSTRLHLGRRAKRIRLELRMDHAVSRILELLQPAAARAFPSVAGGLAALSVRQVATAVRLLPPHARLSLSYDLQAYVASASELRREKAELPLCFALQLQAEVGADQGAQGARSAACAAAALGALQGTNAAELAGQDGVTNQIDVQVQSCALEETYHGPIHIPTCDSASSRPLSSRPLTAGAAAAAKGGRGKGRDGSSGGTSRAGGSKGSSKDGSAAKKVREGRPLTEVIAAANAELSSRYERHAQAGLREICVRLREAASAALAGSDGGASDAQQQQQRSASAPLGPPASGGDGSGTSGSAGAGDAVDGSAAAGRGAGGEVREQRDDLYLLVSLLRRLLLWPVTGELLQATYAGRVVGQLRKHPNEQVAALAKLVTLQWKSAVAAAAAAAAKARATTASAAASPATTPRGTVTSAEGSGKIVRASSFSVPPPSPAAESTRHASEAVRVKARSVMADAIRGHGGSDAADAAPRLAVALEEGLFKAHNGDTGLVYRARLRTLISALKLPNAICPELISGELQPAEVTAMPPHMLALSSAARQELEEKARLKREREDALERAAAFVENMACQRCKGTSIRGQTVMSGGTYAQERVQIRKYLCTDCNHTWKEE